MAEQKSKSIGGLYVKTALSGLDYLSGFIEVGGERLNIVAFANKTKSSDKTPDYSILLSEPRGGGTQGEQKRTPYNSNRPAKPAPKNQSFEDDDSDIPF